MYQNGLPARSGSVQGSGQQSLHAGVPAVQESNLAPFGAFQVVVAGDPDADGVNNFSAGMGTITIQCQPACTVSNSTGVDPLFGNAASGATSLETAENTNCFYGEVPAGSFTQLVQPFGVTRPRLNTVVGGVLPCTVRGAGMYPNSELTIAGRCTFDQTGDIVPIEVASGLKAAADGSFSFDIGCRWASNAQAEQNGDGGARAVIELTLHDAQGNFVSAQLETTGSRMPSWGALAPWAASLASRPRSARAPLRARPEQPW